MKYLSIFLLLCCVNSNAQITGNPHVKDTNAVKLDAEAVNRITGKWKLVRTVEYFQEEEQVRDRGILIDIEKEGAIITSWCNNCQEEKTGQWQILNEQTIKLENNQKEEIKYLAGDWVVYNLTDQEMVLAKLLTSSGDWKKLQYFSRDIENLPVTEINGHCINCSSDGSWCFGERPEEAKRQWVKVNDLLVTGGGQHQHSDEISATIDWLLNNAPCISKALYKNSVKYYENLLKGEQNKHVAQSYKEKIKQIKEQQQLYVIK